MLDNVADAITVQSPDHKLIYANEAAARHYGIPRGQALEEFSAVDLPAALRGHRRRSAARSTSRGCPGRLALAGLDPEPVDRALARPRDRRGALGADQGDRRARPRRRRAAGDQRDRGHHRAQALRGVAALPGRGLAAALGLLAGLRAHAGGGGRAGGARARRPLRRATWSTRRTRRRPEVARGDADRRGVARAGADDRADDRRAGDRDADARGRRRASSTPQDVLVAEDFGLRAGAAVENARLYRAASRIARTLQTSLLPPHAAGRPGRDARGGVPPRRRRGSRSAATSTTSSPPARASGTW